MTEELKEQVAEVLGVMGNEELFDAWRRLTTTIGNPDGMAVYRKEELNSALRDWSPDGIVHILERSESYNSNDAFFSVYGDEMFSTNHLSIEFPPIAKNLDKAIDVIIQKKLSFGSQRLQQVLDGEADESTFLGATEDIERVLAELDVEQIVKIHNQYATHYGKSKELVYPMDELSDVACYGNESLAETVEKIVENSRFSTADDWFRCIDKEYYEYESFSYLDENEWTTEVSFNDLACYIWDMEDDCAIPEIREVIDKHKKYGDKF